MRSSFALAVAFFASLLTVACSDEQRSATPLPGAPSHAGDAGPVVSGDAGAGGDGADALQVGPAPTNKTSLDATIRGVARTLDRAQFGVTKERAGETLYLEAHEGGVAECPEKVTPNRTLIVSGVPRGAPGDRFTNGDGIGVSFIDFIGDQITGNKPSTKATAATVTIVSVTEQESVEIEVDAMFPEGVAKGRIFATSCSAMNQ